MMSVNTQPSQVLVQKDLIPPQSIAANGTAQTGWVDASSGYWIHLKVLLGAVSSGGICTVTWLQATSSGGAGSKALNGGNFASTAFSTANASGEIEDHHEQLDVANNFRYVRAVITITVNTVLASAALSIGPPRFETIASPAS